MENERKCRLFFCLLLIRFEERDKFLILFIKKTYEKIIFIHDG